MLKEELNLNTYIDSLAIHEFADSILLLIKVIEICFVDLSFYPFRPLKERDHFFHCCLIELVGIDSAYSFHFSMIKFVREQCHMEKFFIRVSSLLSSITKRTSSSTALIASLSLFYKWRLLIWSVHLRMLSPVVVFQWNHPWMLMSRL